MGQISKLNYNNIDAFFSKVSEIEHCHFDWNEIRHSFYILREDALHPALSGNKFRKLYGWLKSFYAGEYMELESMGGAHSNHLSALAFACISLNITCTFYVPIGSKSILLDKLKSRPGIKIREVERSEFRALREKSESENRTVLWIPEGGKGANSNIGFETVGAQLKTLGKTCFVSAGTGSTAMCISSMGIRTTAMLAVKDRSVREQLEDVGIEVLETFGIAKFGKLDPDALSIASSFYLQTGILLDPIYQSKALLMLCERQLLTDETVFIHTGGLQGWLGYTEELRNKFPEKVKNEVYANFDAIFTA